MFTNILAQLLEKTWTLFGICWFSCMNANKTKTFRSVFLSNLGFNSWVFLSLDIAGADQGGGGGGLGGYSTPFRTATKNIMRGKKNGNTWITKTLWSQPASQMQLPSIEVWFVRNLWRCTLDEWRRFHFWPTRVSKIFLLAPISSILWRFKSLQCYCSLIAMFWDKPKTTWNKLTYSLVTYWYQPPSIKKILDPPRNIAPHFSESASSPVRHCLRIIIIIIIYIYIAQTSIWIYSVALYNIVILNLC